MPQHKRGPWSQQEDQMLLHLVTVHDASNWVRISNGIQTRSPKQCRERFHQNLKPNLNHDPITPEEGILIEQMVAEMGKRWAEIARRLRGRSDNAVKNWWNGGNNRRRRSVQQRRTELEVRQQIQHTNQPQMHAHPMMQQQQPLPQAFQQHQLMQQHQHQLQQQHYFGQQMYQAGQMGMPTNIPAYARQQMVDAPLPSPSAYSQLSDGGAPSLMSDCSSISARSPNNGTSPIELPPLAAARDDRRRSSAPMLRVGVPNTFIQDNDFAIAQMQSYDLQGKNTPMLQEPFMPHSQGMLHPSQYLPSQVRQPSPLHQSHQMQQMYPMQQQQQQQQHQQTLQRRHSAYPIPSQPVPSTPMTMQLPSISNLSHDSKLDPALSTPGPSGLSLDDSPRDKMSLSNLTH
jgi:Myb-like DNA-binding protein FlbD